MPVATPVLLTTEAVQASLDQTSQLIGQLQKVQRDRLSQPPPPHLALTPGPSENEVQLGMILFPCSNFITYISDGAKISQYCICVAILIHILFL